MSDRLTTRQAAQRLGVSVRRVQALIKGQRLKAERFGALWMVRPADLSRITPGKPGRPRKQS